MSFHSSVSALLSFYAHFQVLIYALYIEDTRMDRKLIMALIGVALIATGLIAVPSISKISYSQESEKKVLRLGYFSNINHAQAVIGVGNGDYQRALGENIEIKPYVFNAGPSAIEALFAKQIDASYIGPNPAINGYVVSGGKDLRIISGATSGGVCICSAK